MSVPAQLAAKVHFTARARMWWWWQILSNNTASGTRKNSLGGEVAACAYLWDCPEER